MEKSIKVRVNDTIRSNISRRAELLNLSVSSYIRYSIAVVHNKLASPNGLMGTPWIETKDPSKWGDVKDSTVIFRVDDNIIGQLDDICENLNLDYSKFIRTLGV